MRRPLLVLSRTTRAAEAMPAAPVSAAAGGADAGAPVASRSEFRGGGQTEDIFSVWRMAT